MDDSAEQVEAGKELVIPSSESGSINDPAGFTTRDSTAAAGPERVLLALYWLFTIASAGRSAYQLIIRPEPALLAYALSAVAAVVYLVGLTLLITARHHPIAINIAQAWCLVELTGVLGIGMWTLLDDARFAAPTVWSDFGAGYGFLPAFLPLVALRWLNSVARETGRVTGSA